MSAVTKDIVSLEPAKAVVAVGASAGVLEAIERFFFSIPPVSKAAYIVIQHLSPDFKSLMSDILSRKTALPVQVVEPDMRLMAGHIYLIPPKKNMIVSAGRFILTDQDSASSLNLPIDICFRSVAREYQRFSVGVIFSDNGVGLTEEGEKIFEIFGKGFSESPNYGAGIGLDLVKRIVDRHGGSVECENNEDAGASFFVSLPW